MTGMSAVAGELRVARFGPRRLVWGSDWPVVDLAGGYDRWRAEQRERARRAVDMLGEEGISLDGDVIDLAIDRLGVPGAMQVVPGGASGAGWTWPVSRWAAPDCPAWSGR